MWCVAGVRGRAARPERLEEEYYTRARYARYERGRSRDREQYGRDYREGYAAERDAYERDAYEREAYGHDYTRDAYRDEFREERPRRDRDPPDEYAPSRRALNAV